MLNAEVRTRGQLRQIVEIIQKYIDENHIYGVDFGHYDDLGQWTPLTTRRIDLLKEVFNEDN